MPATAVAQLPIEALLARVESTVDGAGRFDRREADAALGLASPPLLTVNKALETFYEVAAEDLEGKNADQIRRWKNSRIKVTKNFIEVIGERRCPISPQKTCMRSASGGWTASWRVRPKPTRRIRISRT